MADPALLVALASTGTLAIAVTAATGLRAWTGWLEVRRLEVGRSGRGRQGKDLAELRSRIRRLEAIANGSDV